MVKFAFEEEGFMKPHLITLLRHNVEGEIEIEGKETKFESAKS